jgi:hypothetical protein
MIELDPSDTFEIAFALQKAVKKSRIPRDVILASLKEQYGVELSSSAFTHLLNRGTIGLQRALQVLDVIGETEITIRHVPK